MKHVKQLLSGVLVLVVLVTSSPTVLASQWQEEDFDSDMLAYAQEVCRLINVERVKNGLHELEWDWDLAMCAQIRAEEMARQTRNGHTRPEPPHDTDKVWPKNVNGHGDYNAPSVADELGVDYNWILECSVAQRSTPQAAVDAWKGSPGHWNVIMKERVTRCAAGVYFTTEQTPTGWKNFWALWLD